MKIILCSEKNIKEAAELFNRYRMFYEQKDDYDSCYSFIKTNVEHNRSIIFLLLDDTNNAIAFSQLYPSYCSVEMQPICYLYDLYVDKATRGKGYSKVLMNYIIEYFKDTDVVRLTLDTALTNKIAQNLYESIGYKRESDFIMYHYRY